MPIFGVEWGKNVLKIEFGKIKSLHTVSETAITRPGLNADRDFILSADATTLSSKSIDFSRKEICSWHLSPILKFQCGCKINVTSSHQRHSM